MDEGSEPTLGRIRVGPLVWLIVIACVGWQVTTLFALRVTGCGDACDQTLLSWAQNPMPYVLIALIAVAWVGSRLNRPQAAKIAWFVGAVMVTYLVACAVATIVATPAVAVQ